MRVPLGPTVAHSITFTGASASLTRALPGLEAVLAKETRRPHELGFVASGQDLPSKQHVSAW